MNARLLVLKAGLMTAKLGNLGEIGAQISQVVKEALDKATHDFTKKLAVEVLALLMVCSQDQFTEHLPHFLAQIDQEQSEPAKSEVFQVMLSTLFDSCIVHSLFVRR